MVPLTRGEEGGEERGGIVMGLLWSNGRRGWWNLMMHPLLRVSLASMKARRGRTGPELALEGMGFGGA